VASPTQATKLLDEDDWKGLFKLSDTKGKGSLSFSEFRRAVRRANIKPSAISDEDLVSIVKMVDTDGSGFIELGEFLSFLRPEHIPDIECRASSWVSTSAVPMCMPV
jgi:Ca2+-binding EF-hand superfamily protein